MKENQIKDHCAGCVHFRPLSTKTSTSRLWACHYILDMGHSRGCEASACTINHTAKGAAIA